jgi:hypothetical protein
MVQVVGPKKKGPNTMSATDNEVIDFVAKSLNNAMKVADVLEGLHFDDVLGALSIAIAGACKSKEELDIALKAINKGANVWLEFQESWRTRNATQPEQ